MNNVQKQKGITLIALVITIIVLVILSAVGIYFTLGNNGILNKAKEAKNETSKQVATEKMNLKITNMQIETYGEEKRMPTLQEFADGLCKDDEIQYVELQSKKLGSLNKIEVGNASSIFTKLKEYPYEFEINASLQLASIDGVKVATTPTEITTGYINYSTEEQTVGTWIDGKTIYQKTIVYNQLLPGNNSYINLTLDCTNMDNIISQLAFYTMDSCQFTSDGGRGWVNIDKSLNRLYVGQNQTGGVNTVTLVAVTIQYTKTN